MLDPPRVKVCGLTTAVDVHLAVSAGADAVGFVLHTPSPRSVREGQLPGLLSTVPEGVLGVLVVVDRDPVAIARLLEATPAGAVQLCGNESPGDWAGFPVPIFRRLAVGDGARAEAEPWQDVASVFVLDHPAAPGGTGCRVDLAVAAALAAELPCLLAGGLDAGNVAAAVARVRPRGVDASSSLESRPGRKDARHVRAFVRAARAALDRLDSPETCR